MTERDALDLADWRSRIAKLYLSDFDLTGFRTRRDELFASHPQSPIPSHERPGFAGLRYFDENPRAECEALLRPATGELEIDTGGPDGIVRYRRIGIADTEFGSLTLWWIDAYGGGLFLPFRDGTCGRGRTAAADTSRTPSRAPTAAVWLCSTLTGCGWTSTTPTTRHVPSILHGRVRCRRARTGWTRRSGPVRWTTTDLEARRDLHRQAAHQRSLTGLDLLAHLPEQRLAGVGVPVGEDDHCGIVAVCPGTSEHQLALKSR